MSWAVQGRTTYRVTALDFNVEMGEWQCVVNV
jgi:hypothetical protein